MGIAAPTVLKALALSPLLDDESAFEESFQQPVALIPPPPETADARPPRRTTRPIKPSATIVGSRTPPPHQQRIESYLLAAVVPIFGPDRVDATVTRIGRALANDIVISLPTVSKHHGEFRLLPEGKTTYVDLDSTNGSFVRGRLLAARDPVSLENGFEVALSAEVSVTYLTPTGLLRLARLVRDQLRDDDED